MPPSSAAPRRASEDAERSHPRPPAESVIGLFKTEQIKPRGPWRTAEQVELATLEYVDWFNHRRLYGACGDIPPAELDAAYYRQNAALTEAGQTTT
jgi:putative transposase